MFGGISWSNIIEGICITVGSTVALTLLYRFRKIIAAWLKRRFNRLRRFMKISQCFPRHTLEFRNLIRQNRKLLQVNRILQAEINKTQLQATQKEKQLGEAQEKLLLFALNHEPWSKSEVAQSLNWNTEFTDIVIAKAVKSDLISGGYNPAGIYRWRITTSGRRFLFDRGLLSER